MGMFDFGKKEKKKEVSKKVEKVEIPEGSIVFRAIIELLGAPKSYIEDTMNAYIEKIKGDDDYKLLKSSISKAKKVKEDKKNTDPELKGKELYSTFAEAEISTKKKEKIFDFCFRFLPSSMEIVQPMSISFDANDVSGFLSDIQATLHKIDFDLKRVNAENQILKKSMVRMLRNNILLSVREKSKDIKEISKNVGIEEAQLKPFIENMLTDKEIKLEKGKYSATK